MFGKNLCLWLITALLIISVGSAQACVGRILYVGALDTPDGRVMAELLVLLINERTGTNVKIRFMDNNDQLYAALKALDEKDRIDIIVEDTANAMAILKLERKSDLDAELTEAKENYEKKLDIIWLNPFGFKNRGGKANSTISAPLVRRDVLTNFPLLPRVLNKLSGAISDETYTDLISKAKSGDKAKNIAKDFLKEKKFI
ncbi:MAG: hypothetical protein KKB30_08960 [Proteobacteria bacterium]|nr:hypothetical protein [Pseudomonadota bacterium]MBU1714051.1 hypothetical protein [Pseudomonadota bacterium]